MGLVASGGRTPRPGGWVLALLALGWGLFALALLKPTGAPPPASPSPSPVAEAPQPSSSGPRLRKLPKLAALDPRVLRATDTAWCAVTRAGSLVTFTADTLPKTLIQLDDWTGLHVAGAFDGEHWIFPMRRGGFGAVGPMGLSLLKGPPVRDLRAIALNSVDTFLADSKGIHAWGSTTEGSLLGPAPTSLVADDRHLAAAMPDGVHLFALPGLKASTHFPWGPVEHFTMAGDWVVFANAEGKLGAAQRDGRAGWYFTKERVDCLAASERGYFAVGRHAAVSIHRLESGDPVHHATVAGQSCSAGLVTGARAS